MGYQQLKNIVDENKRIAEEEKIRPVTECPECCYSPLKQSEKTKDLLCPICGWSNRR